MKPDFSSALPLTHTSRKVLAAIPCYNEELTIGTIVLKAKKYVDEVLVIDDGSKDGTAEVARHAGATIVPHTENRGKAAGVITAVHYARNNTYDILVLLDGDGQHNPDEIPHVLKPVIEEKVDLVIGSRYLKSTNNTPTYRRLGQKTLDIATNGVARYKSSDSQSGFRALSRKALMQFDLTSKDYNNESDMITHFTDQGLSIAEVPITARYVTINSHKKNSFSHGFDILSHLIGLIGYRRPLLSFGIPGGLLTIGGLIAGLYTFSEYFATKSFHYIVFIISITLIILGLLLIVAALILNSLVLILKEQK